MKTKLFKLVPLVCGLALTGGLYSCGETPVDPQPGPGPDDNTPVEQFVVTYYDGDTVIHTENVESGKTAPEWDPSSTVTGKTFLGWYGEPTLTHEYDFTQPVTDDLSIFGSFVSYEKDTREWAIAGSGSTELLMSSNWGKVFEEEHYMKNESTATENIYTITVNLFKEDQFQFTVPVLNEETGAYSWGHQRGGGYLDEPTRDGVEYFQVGGGLGEDNYTANITALVDGQYKFTLYTYPAGDFQKDDSPEPYNNRNYYDHIERERVGDSTEQKAETTTDFYLKGEFITNWADLMNDHTKMVEKDGIYTLENVYLKAADQFMFASYVTNSDTGVGTAGTEYIRGSNLTEESKALVTGESNMKVLADGYYDFSYDFETKLLTVTKDETYVLPNGSYYVDGNFGGRNWAIEETLKLVPSSEDSEVLELAEPIEVTAVDQELGIQFYDSTSSSPYLDFFGSSYVASASEAYDLTANNIKFKTIGEYDISFNTYSHIISITPIN